jgi:biotin-(acetyl-CoA carboxylase) ligase
MSGGLAHEREMALPGGLDLPPGYTAVSLREVGDAFVHAQSIAAEAGAGTLVWVRRFDTVEFALVVEPGEPLRIARRALYFAMNALADAVASHCPPEKPIQFEWPDTLMLDGGMLGGVQIATPPAADDSRPPDWMVIGIKIRSVVPNAPARPGGHALDQPFVRGTSLESEGFEMMDAADLIGSFARHFMVYVDQLQEFGFAAVGKHYLERLSRSGGIRHRLTNEGDLEIVDLRKPGLVERRVLAEVLAVPQWLDPVTGDPWL